MIGESRFMLGSGNVTISSDPKWRHPRGDLNHFSIPHGPFDVSGKMPKEDRQTKGQVSSYTGAVMSLVRLDSAKLAIDLTTQLQVLDYLLWCQDRLLPTLNGGKPTMLVSG